MEKRSLVFGKGKTCLREKSVKMWAKKHLAVNLSGFNCSLKFSLEYNFFLEFYFPITIGLLICFQHKMSSSSNISAHTTQFNSREEVTAAIRAQKVRLGLKWADIALEVCGPEVSKEWVTAACLGQMKFNAAEADKLVRIFQLSPDAKHWLQSAPTKGGEMPSANDPLLYRFQEVRDFECEWNGMERLFFK